MIKIKTDSRKVLPGDTFVALPGISSDGHDYIEKAIENGASKIIAQHGSYSVETIVVDDTRSYLNELLESEYGNILNDMTLIGITGTNGKTTSSYLIYQMLNKLNIPCSYIGTIGFYLDKKVRNLPNTSVDIADFYGLLIEAYEKGYKHSVVEVSSQGLSMQRFAGVKFDIGVFTNLTQDHLDYHGSMENYALAKQLLFKKLKKSGKAIINSDDEYKDYYLLEENNNITFGLNSGDYRINDFKMNNLNTVFNYSFNDEQYQTNSTLIGKYNLYNLITSIGVVHELGINFDEINKVVPLISSPNGRMDKINYLDNTIIIDYAHTPDAIENIISTVKEVTDGNLYVVFGCTGSRDKSKRPIMTNLVLSNVDKAIITIDDPHDESPVEIVNDMLENNSLTNYKVELNRGKAIRIGIDLLREKDTLLILGKGHEEVIILGDKKIPFNDREEVLKYIEELKLKIR